METLMGSSWKIFPLKFGEKDRLVWRPGDASLSRKENGLPRNQKRDVFLRFPLSVSIPCKTVRSVSGVASAQSPENQTLVESEETDPILVADLPKTTHVRFKLTKECAFGQHFLIVGDDQSLGLWDPSDGVPFDWSDGHVWTAALDVPCGKVIKYKFILKVDDNTIWWQPGPDRILETWETEKTIAVFEDWDHPELQNIAEEEEFIADLNDEKALINSELLTVSETLSKTTQGEGADVKKQLVGTNDSSLADEDVEFKVKQELNTNTKYSKHEQSSASKQETPVLLPGLIPLLTDEDSPNEVEPRNEDEELKDVFEDCDHPERQNIAEEEFIVDLNDEKSLINSELLTVTENLSRTKQDEGTDVKKQLVGTNDSSLADEDVEFKVKQDLNTNTKYSKHDQSSASKQEAPVLLLGLIPPLTDEESPNEVESKNEDEEASLGSRETSKMVMQNEQEFYRKEQLETSEVRMPWGRGMLKKFLAIFGF